MIYGQLIEFFHHFIRDEKHRKKKLFPRTKQNIEIINYFPLKTFGLTLSIEIGFAFLKTRADDKQICEESKKLKQNERAKKKVGAD